MDYQERAPGAFRINRIKRERQTLVKTVSSPTVFAGELSASKPLMTILFPIAGLLYNLAWNLPLPEGETRRVKMTLTSVGGRVSTLEQSIHAGFWRTPDSIPVEEGDVLTFEILDPESYPDAGMLASCVFKAQETPIEYKVGPLFLPRA